MDQDETYRAGPGAEVGWEGAADRITAALNNCGGDSACRVGVAPDDLRLALSRAQTAEAELAALRGRWKPREGFATHDLKCWPEFYRAVKRGDKPWELRRNDRDFRTGDVLRLREYEPGSDAYSGDEGWYGVSFTLYGEGGWLPKGSCIMSLVPLPDPPSPDGERLEGEE